MQRKGYEQTDRVRREEGPAPERRVRLPKPAQKEKSVSLWSILKVRSAAYLSCSWQRLSARAPGSVIGRPCRMQHQVTQVTLPCQSYVYLQKWLPQFSCVVLPLHKVPD